MGMTKRQVLTRIELPLAVPVIMAGLRTALVINVGTATLGAFIGAGGLGSLIVVAGYSSNHPYITIIGGILVAVLALLVDYVGGHRRGPHAPEGTVIARLDDQPEQHDHPQPKVRALCATRRG